MERAKDGATRFSDEIRRAQIVVIENDTQLRLNIVDAFRELPGIAGVSEFQSIDEFKPSRLSRAVNLIILDPAQIDELEQDGPALLDNPAVGVVLFTDIPVGTLGILFCRAAVIGAVPKLSGVAALQRFTQRSCLRVLHDRLDSEAAVGPILSPRERQTLSLVGMGFTHKEVAERMAISAKSVETYKARACHKLGITKRSQIVALANRLQDPVGHTLNPIQIDERIPQRSNWVFSSRRRGSDLMM